MPPKKDRGNDQSHRGNDLPDARLRNLQRVMGADKVTTERTHRHYPGFRPVDDAGIDEPDGSDDVDQRTEDVLHRIHLVDVREPHETQRCEHKNPDPGAEIAAIDGHGKLKGNGRPHGYPMRRRWPFRIQSGKPAKSALRNEKNGREQQQVRHEPLERLVAGVREENAAQPSTHEAHRKKSHQPKPHTSDLLAKSENAPGGSEDQRQRARGIGDSLGGAKENERGKRDQRSPARDRIDRAGGKGRTGQGQSFQKRHVISRAGLQPRTHPFYKLRHGGGCIAFVAKRGKLRITRRIACWI